MKRLGIVLLCVFCLLSTWLCAGAFPGDAAPDPPAQPGGAYPAAQDAGIAPASAFRGAAGPRVVVEDWQALTAEAPVVLVVHVDAENIVVRQGTEFSIAVDAGSENSYAIRDNRGVPYAERYFYYPHWDLIFEHKDKQGGAGALSSTVTVTIPESDETQFLYLKSGTGKISMEGLRGVDLILETDGDISVRDTGAEDITIYRGNNIELLDVTVTEDIQIRYKSYYGGEYMTGPDGAHTIILAAKD